MNKKLLLSLVICNLGLVAVQLGISFYRSTDGIYLHEISKSLEFTRQESLRLTQQIHQESSISKIGEKAAKLDLVVGQVKFVEAPKYAQAYLEH